MKIEGDSNVKIFERFKIEYPTNNKFQGNSTFGEKTGNIIVFQGYVPILKNFLLFYMFTSVII